MKLENISVMGAGSWGTALSKLLADTGREVKVWCYEKDVADGINNSHENHVFLPGFTLPENLKAFNDFEPVLKDANLVLSVIPGHSLRSVWKSAGKHLAEDAVILSCTKGIEYESGRLMTDVIMEEVDSGVNMACLSGPSFAREVAAGLPSAVVVASEDIKLAEAVQQEISGPEFRIYSSDDVKGVELGGALKNVIAIAAGAAEGMGLGTNAMAALITRGLAEITRLAVALGANPFTLSGLSGMGDLVLTCTGPLSRNRKVGERLAHGETISDIIASMNMVAEGYYTARSVHKVSKEAVVEMAISEIIYKVLYEDFDIRKAVGMLMQRDLKQEREF